ncbi:uncharacterized protein MELLADRAFT_58630 [Melampsora larici-populina 98AG31]|uniref:Uncharacterized protein n=1 Tax=Melampsora larici-populina (strain 98AG31 / pathotype 3-4-7) TaxID=747676 RepID=F4R497_MELLP|nr:uncharacterized protein MELLADRAFT_58630 [Melampsora larici-populina 98AG31]EGG12770.1 hypothetical protein MELLADRAFT_58630 [Melampsora larici-populina 98AG31]
MASKISTMQKDVGRVSPDNNHSSTTGQVHNYPINKSIEIIRSHHRSLECPRSKLATQRPQLWCSSSHSRASQEGNDLSVRSGKQKQSDSPSGTLVSPEGSDPEISDDEIDIDDLYEMCVSEDWGNLDGGLTASTASSLHKTNTLMRKLESPARHVSDSDDETFSDLFEKESATCSETTTSTSSGRSPTSKLSSKNIHGVASNKANLFTDRFCPGIIDDLETEEDSEEEESFEDQEEDNTDPFGLLPLIQQDHIFLEKVEAPSSSDKARSITKTKENPAWPASSSTSLTRESLQDKAGAWARPFGYRYKAERTILTLEAQTLKLKQLARYSHLRSQIWKRPREGTTELITIPESFSE